MFEEKKQNKHRTLLQQLFSLKFAISAKNRFETFEKFFARFTLTISFLRLSNNDKIMHFYRNFFDQLTEKIYHFNGLIKYSKYVKGVRQVINQIKIRSDIAHNATISIISVKDRITRTINLTRKDTNFKKFLRDRSKTKGQSSLNIMLKRLSTHIRQKFKKNGKCFKCEEKNYIFVNKNVLCKDKNVITREKTKTLLSKMNIEYIETDFVY